MHTFGWPSKSKAGSYFYHGENNQVYIGLVVPLDYSNPHLSPFDEFQQWKQHKDIKKILESGTRVAYGARALIKGGYQSRPKMTFPGGLIVGDNAGTLVFTKIKGTHTAMKSGMLAAVTVFDAVHNNNLDADLELNLRIPSAFSTALPLTKSATSLIFLGDIEQLLSFAKNKFFLFSLITAAVFLFLLPMI